MLRLLYRAPFALLLLTFLRPVASGWLAANSHACSMQCCQRSRAHACCKRTAPGKSTITAPSQCRGCCQSTAPAPFTPFLATSVTLAGWPLPRSTTFTATAAHHPSLTLLPHSSFSRPPPHSA